MLKVDIPYTFNKKTMYHFIDSVIDSGMNPRHNQIEFNFNNLGFTEPAGVTILSNVIEWLKKRDVHVFFSYPKDTNVNPSDGIKYLDDSMFFKYYLKENLTDNACVRNTTIPIKHIKYDKSYMWLDSNFLPWLSSQLSVSISSLIDIKVSFGEIFNNIRDHAEENTGCIFAQHYPRKEKINISISDFGVGIPNTIRRMYPYLNDEEALIKAIEEGVSSKSTPRNRGAGLKTLLQNVVVNHGGTLHIRSYSGVLTVKKNNLGKLVLYSNITKQKYPGTFIEIIFDTQKFESIFDNEEEFEWDW